MFKQGSLDSGQFVVNNPTTNQIIDIDATNINNDDVWLYKLDSSGQEAEYWTKVEAVEGNNVIYNSISKKVRTETENSKLDEITKNVVLNSKK